MTTERPKPNFPTLKCLLLLGFSVQALAGDMISGAAAQTRDHGVALSYDIFLGGFLSGTVDLSAKITDGHYHITTISSTHGVLDYLIELRRRNEVMGRFVAEKAYPTTYNTTGQWAGKDRSVQIEYGTQGDSGNIVRFVARPGAVEDEREAVPSNLLPGTMDPISAMYEALLRNEATGSCDGIAKVFDGRRRYNFRFQSIGNVDAGTLKDKAQLFSAPPGLVQICRIRQNILAGASKRKWLPRFVRPEWTDIWLAKIRADLPALPLRLEADAGMGAMVARLVAVGGRIYPPGEGPKSAASAAPTDKLYDRPRDDQK
ncbi:MAG: DUF3108 domain-containing protein [Rhodospirillaceae bacterium]|jgi:hypothetical protein|nr:DUF3108 domain-containing protein [Rhodospirillaceae bacterium]